MGGATPGYESGRFQSPSGSVPVTYMSAGGRRRARTLHRIRPGRRRASLLERQRHKANSAPGQVRGNVPDADQWLSRQFVATLDSSTLDRITNGLSIQPVDLEIPGIDISSTLDLVFGPQSMGMTDAFGPSADLSGMTQAGHPTERGEAEGDLACDEIRNSRLAATAVSRRFCR